MKWKFFTFCFENYLYFPKFSLAPPATKTKYKFKMQRGGESMRHKHYWHF